MALTLAKNSQALFGLLALTVCYQIVYQAIMFNHLQKDDKLATPCGVGSAVTSPECLEHRLFQGWQRAEVGGYSSIDEAEGDLETLLQVLEPASSKPAPSAESTNPADAPHTFALRGQTKRIQETSVSPSVNPQDSEERAEKIYEKVMSSLSSESETSHWGQDLVKMQDAMEERMMHSPGIREARANHRHHDFDKLYNETLAAIKGRNENRVSPWAHHLQEIMDESDAKVAKHSSSGREHRPEQSHRANVKANLQDEILKFGRELCDTPQHRALPACAKFLSSGAQQSNTLEPSVVGRFSDTRSSHADVPALVEQKIGDLALSHEAWQKKFADNIDDYTHELCSDPLRKSYPICAHIHSSERHVSGLSTSSSAALRGGGQPTASTAPASRRPSNFLAKSDEAELLSWSAVVVKHKKSKAIHSERTVEQLRGMKWEGTPPSAICVTAVPAGQDTATKLKDLVRNFRAQTYEGRHELVLVYQNSDAEVRELVHSYADGVLIKATAARSGGQFPSTSAFRYAAWAAHADVIARWDFEQWHHPERLSMQIRALAAARRPVSLLKQWTVVGPVMQHGKEQLSEASLSDELGWESSLVGEAGWMRQHWMPLMKEERSILESLQASHLVQVDAPKMSILTVRTPKDFADAIATPFA